MNIRSWIAAVICVFTWACNNGTSDDAAQQQTDTAPSAPEAPAAPEPPSPPPVKEFKTKTGKIFLLEESHPQGMSLSDISIRFADDESPALTFSDLDPVNKVLVGDLDKNGYDELYVITTAAGSGSYGGLRGFASLKDKSIGMVSLPEVSEKDMVKGGPFEGYEGHDEFEIINDELVRTFPVKSDKGTRKTITYKMVPGEATYQLVIKSSKLK